MYIDKEYTIENRTTIYDNSNFKTAVCIPAKLTPHSGKLTPHCLRLSIAYPTVKVIYFFSWIHL